MGKVFTVQVKGLQGVIARNNAFIKNVSDKTDELLNKTANKIEMDAQALCKVSSIAGTIAVSVNAKNDYQINAGDGLDNPAIAAYTEFGTGNFAASLVPTLPQDWQAYAKTFYINGLGRLPAAPYMYPAFASNTVMTVDQIKNIINAEGRR